MYVKCWVTYNQWCRKYINYVFEYIFFYYGINLSVCNCLSVVNISGQEARFTSTERCTDQIFCCFLLPKASGLHNECSWTVRVYQNLQAYPHIWPHKKIITVYQNKIYFFVTTMPCPYNDNLRFYKPKFSQYLRVNNNN